MRRPAWRRPLLAAFLTAAGCHGGSGRGTPLRPRLAVRAVATRALLQAVHAVDDSVAWAAGHADTWLRTVDGGSRWSVGAVPGAEGLEFRDVWAAGPDTAFLLAAGPGDRSRIYATTDGGRSWTARFVNRDTAAFFDCLDFEDARHGLVFGDARDGRFPILRTDDGGRSWTAVADSLLPAARTGEAGFAASGGCVAAGPGGRVWIGTGATDAPRVLRARGPGPWSAAPVPLSGGSAAGVMAVSFRDGLHGIAVGGDLDRRPDVDSGAAAGDRADRPSGPGGGRVAITSDGGRSWRPGGDPRLVGPVFGVAWVPGAPSPTVVAVGPGGADYSIDGGRSWARLDTAAYWSVSFASLSTGWMVGPGGKVTRVSFVPPGRP